MKIRAPRLLRSANFVACSTMRAAEKIVVVEDLFVRNFVRTALERQGHAVVCASISQATEFLRAGCANLLITNTPAEFAEFGATVPLLYMAAFPDPANASRFKRWRAICKPFQNAELTSLVSQLLAPV